GAADPAARSARPGGRSCRPGRGKAAAAAPRPHPRAAAAGPGAQAAPGGMPPARWRAPMTGLASNDPARVAAFVALFRRPAQELIANLDTRVELLEAGGVAFPLTVNDG